VDSRLDSLGKLLTELGGDIKKIFERLPPPVPVASQSPRQLTSFGERISDFLKAKDWASELAPTLLSRVENKRPFEVDEFARAYVRGSLTPEWRDRVAGCAYEFGTDRDGIHDVLQVVLREELLRMQQQPPVT